MTLKELRDKLNAHYKAEPAWFEDEDGTWFGYHDAWLIKLGMLYAWVERAEQAGRNPDDDVSDLEAPKKGSSK